MNRFWALVLSFGLLMTTLSVSWADDFVPEGESDMAISAETFILDADDTGSDITLQFGATLGEFLRWDSTNSRFELSEDLDFAAAQLVNARFENLGAAPVCDGPATGRIYFNTVESAPFVCNGTSWEQLGTISSQPLASARLRDTSTTNINALATDNIVPWDTQDFIDPVFVHDTVTNNSRVQVDADGKYLVSGAISIFSTGARYNGIVKFRVNGVTALPMTFQPGYIRAASGNNETSLTFSTILELSAGDYFEVLVDRESIGTAATMISGASSLSLMQLETVVAAAPGGGGGAPFVDVGFSSIIQPSTTQTISITGSGFLPSSTVSFPGFSGTINSTTVVGPGQIDVNVTTDAVQTTYDIVVDNSGTDNTVWPSNGVDGFEVLSITGTGVAGTYTESFETNFGSWVTSGLAAYWERNAGATGSAGTGPNGASAGTTYIYTETSAPDFPDVEFGLETTDFAVAQSISFDYHRFGSTIGDLEIQTLFGGVWTTRFTLSGQQQFANGDAYLNQFVDLSPFPVEAIRFFYTSGANFDGDGALDNIVIIST